jgi:hypothetical protein
MSRYVVERLPYVDALLSHYECAEDTYVEAPTYLDQACSEQKFYDAQILKLKRAYLGLFSTSNTLMYGDFLDKLVVSQLASDFENAQKLTHVLIQTRIFPISTRFGRPKNLEFLLRSSKHEATDFVIVSLQ